MKRPLNIKPETAKINLTPSPVQKIWFRISCSVLLHIFICIVNFYIVNKSMQYQTNQADLTCF
uniref:Uncharacterized protein n=1 Tax=Romanomermis culicivorax TaxID=13658 RepID=A0A915JBL9_ROMCU